MQNFNKLGELLRHQFKESVKNRQNFRPPIFRIILLYTERYNFRRPIVFSLALEFNLATRYFGFFSLVIFEDIKNYILQLQDISKIINTGLMNLPISVKKFWFIGHYTQTLIGGLVFVTNLYGTLKCIRLIQVCWALYSTTRPYVGFSPLIFFLGVFVSFQNLCFDNSKLYDITNILFVTGLKCVQKKRSYELSKNAIFTL